MSQSSGRSDSLIALTADVVSAKILVWVASVGREADLTRDAHLFFYDRYCRLARYHQSRGREARTPAGRQSRRSLPCTGRGRSAVRRSYGDAPAIAIRRQRSREQQAIR
jgi:hypothetical protein